MTMFEPDTEKGRALYYMKVLQRNNIMYQQEIRNAISIAVAVLEDIVALEEGKQS